MTIEIQTKTGDTLLTLDIVTFALASAVSDSEVYIPDEDISDIFVVEVTTITEVYLQNYSKYLIELLDDSPVLVEDLVEGLGKINDFPSWVDNIYLPTRGATSNSYTELIEEATNLVREVADEFNLTYTVDYD